MQLLNFHLIKSNFASFDVIFIFTFFCLTKDPTQRTVTNFNYLHLYRFKSKNQKQKKSHFQSNDKQILIAIKLEHCINSH